MAETLPKTLAGRLSLALSKIKRIPKRGRNDAMNYSFVRADDVAEGVRDILFECGLGITADVVDAGLREVETKYKDGTSKVTRISTCRVAWTFLNTDDKDDKATVHTPGEGMDTGDKGIYKSMTGAMKYALMLNFLIPTGDGPVVVEVPADPENENEHDRDEKKGSASQPEPAVVQGKNDKNGSAREAVKKAQRTPAVRKKEALDRLTAIGFSDAEIRSGLAANLHRTIPATGEIRLASEDELVKVEAWVLSCEAEASQAANPQ